MTFTIQLDQSEVLEAVTLLDFVGSDLADPTGYIILTSDGTQRVWAATDRVSAVWLHGRVDDREYRVVLSPTQFAFLLTAAHSGDDPTITIGGDDVTYLTARHAEMKAASHSSFHPLFDYDPLSVASGATGEFNVREVSMHLECLLVDLDTPEGGPVVCTIALNEGYLNFTCPDVGGGTVKSRLAGRGVSGDVMLSVDLRRLKNMFSALPPESDVKVHFPMYQGEPIRVETTGRVVTVMPWKTPWEISREHVEGVIESVFGDLALRRDDDGDYPLRRHGHRIFGRLSEDGSPVAFQVFGVLLHDVEATPELLAEMNAINSRLSFARLMHVEEALIVEADLVAQSMDELELETAVSKIARAVEDYAPTLSVMFGGARAADPMEDRWNSYRSTIIQAEVSPGQTEHLNGVEALVPWPFPQPVHIVSGWNPQGVKVDGEWVNSQIAADVLRRGGRFVMCAGVSRDGNYSEPSLAIWGLSREEARDIGRKASQDAIFEIVDEEIRLVACFMDKLEAFPRREGPSSNHHKGYL